MFTIKNNEEVYSAPECMVISVKVQGVVCASPGNPDLDGDEEMGDIG